MLDVGAAKKRKKLRGFLMEVEAWLQPCIDTISLA